MGERALAAVRQGSSLFLYRSQWGGLDSVLEAVFSAPDPCGPLFELEWEPQTTCEPHQLEASVNFLTTAVVYVIEETALTVYLPLWFGLPDRAGTLDETRGVLVGVDSATRVRVCRTALERCKEEVLDGIWAGTYSTEHGQRLLARVERLVRVTTPTVDL